MPELSSNANTTGLVLKVGVDTNCFIDATTPSSPNHDAARRLFEAGETGQITLFVSHHTLQELSRVEDAAYELGRRINVLGCYPFETWDDLVGTWNDLRGTWDEIGVSDETQREMRELANAGTDIRDRGALLDALRADLDVFVTSDNQLAKEGPASRIASRFGIRVLTPSSVLELL